MNIRIKALLQTLAVLGFCSAAGVITVVALQHIPTHIIALLGVGFLVVMAVYVLYNVRLNQLEYEQRLREIVAQK